MSTLHFFTKWSARKDAIANEVNAYNSIVCALKTLKHAKKENASVPIVTMTIERLLLRLEKIKDNSLDKRHVVDAIAKRIIVRKTIAFVTTVAVSATRIFATAINVITT